MADVAPRTARALLVAVAALAAAAGVGVLAGAAVALAARPVLAGQGRDVWDDLAALALGVVTAGAVAVLVWGVALVVVARRLFPRGSRALPVLLALGTTAAAVLVAGAVRDAVGPAAPGLVVAALVVPTLVVLPWWEARWRRRADARAGQPVA